MSSSNRLQLSPRITRHRLTLVIGLIAIINSLLLVGTFSLLFSLGDSVSLTSGSWKGGFHSFLSAFNLTQENNFSSWYSSMLLLGISAISLLCFLTDLQYEEKKEYRQLGFGWLAISTIFFVLSADEMGSFHERIGMLDLIPSDKALGWVPIFEVPIGLMAGFLAIFSWLKMSRYRSAVILSIIGIGFYLMNPTLEELQNILLNSSSLTIAQQKLYNMSLLIEEGAELFGSLSFLSAILLYCGHRLKTFNSLPEQSETALSLDISIVSLLNILSTWLGASVFLMMSLQRLNLQGWQGDVGIPSNWFPAATAFLAGLICLLNLGDDERNSSEYSHLYWSYATLCWVLSLYYGLNAPGILAMDSLSQNLLLENLQRLVIVVAVLLNLGLGSLAKQWKIKLAMWLWPLLLGFSFYLNTTGVASFFDLGTMLSLFLLLSFQLYYSPKQEPRLSRISPS